MQFTPSDKTPYSSVLKRLMTWTAVFAVSLTIIFTFSKTAHAGLVSFMSALLGSEQASAKTDFVPVSHNSQTIALLQAAANTDPNPDKPSDTIPVDHDEVLSADLAAMNSTTGHDLNTQISSYIIQPDDTLSGIADIFGISVETIKNANNLSGKAIHVGQTLQILPVSGVLYTVKSGDTLLGIVKKYSADLSNTLLYNGLTMSSTLSAGTKLVIPNVKPLTTTTLSIVQRQKVPSFEPLLDNISSWPSDSSFYSCPVSGARLSQGLHGHNGVDLAAPLSTSIRAAAAGIVTVDRVNGLWNGGYGNFIIISHANGTQTLYAHMSGASKNLVSTGDHVTQAQLIGYVGMTGLTTGPHVHFEVRGAQNPFATVTCN